MEGLFALTDSDEIFLVTCYFLRIARMGHVALPVCAFFRVSVGQ